MTQERKAELRAAIDRLEGMRADHGAQLLGITPPDHHQSMHLYWIQCMRELGVPKRFWPDNEPQNALRALRWWSAEDFPKV